MTYNIQLNENKEFETNLKLIKRQAPIRFGQMPPYYREEVKGVCESIKDVSNNKSLKL